MKKSIFTIVLLISISLGSHAQEGLIGEVKLFAGNFAPRGWAFCEGQLLAINSHQALFSILGTTYGGDGRTTFALPDLRGRVPVQRGSGPGLSPVRLGQRFGVAEIPMGERAVTNVPVHQIDPSDGSKLVPGNTAILSVGNEANAKFRSGNPDAKASNYQPSLGLNYIICLIGIFPSRN
jgi:microcystin-dependent protein